MIVACAGDGDEDGGQEDVDRVRCAHMGEYVAAGIIESFLEFNFTNNIFVLKVQE